jgi:hypothetical protein
MRGPGPKWHAKASSEAGNKDKDTDDGDAYEPQKARGVSYVTR